MNCPACGYYNPSGQQRCFQCGLVLPTSAGGDALCARHAEVKAIGACSRCGTFGCGQCLSSQGDAWLCPDCLGRLATLPWDEREQLGLWRAWWRTSTQLISSPSQSFETAQPDGDLGGSLVFAVFSALAGFGTTILGYAVVLVPIFMLGSKGGSLKPVEALLVPGAMILYGVMLLFMQIFGVLFAAGLDHLGLLLLGAQPKSYSVSVRANALSMAPYLVGLVPLCGLYVFPLWALVLRVMALRAFHRTTLGKAVAAVLIPIVGLCGLMLIFYAAVFALAANAGR